MMEANGAALRHRLIDRYDEFVRRLGRQLGSTDVAREVVHETYLRLERVKETGPIQNLDGYIFRTAVNIAKNRMVKDRRYLSASETEALIGIPDDRPDPARVAEARSETDLVRRALALLPLRQRQIFEASWGDETPHLELAIRHGVHLRTIQRELEHATSFVRQWCNENNAAERRISPQKLSPK